MTPTKHLIDHLRTVELMTGLDVSELAVVAVIVPPAKILRHLTDEHGQRLYIIRKPPPPVPLLRVNKGAAR